MQIHIQCMWTDTYSMHTCIYIFDEFIQIHIQYGGWYLEEEEASGLLVRLRLAGVRLRERRQVRGRHQLHQPLINPLQPAICLDST